MAFREACDYFHAEASCDFATASRTIDVTTTTTGDSNVPGDLAVYPQVFHRTADRSIAGNPPGSRTKRDGRSFCFRASLSRSLSVPRAVCVVDRRAPVTKLPRVFEGTTLRLAESQDSIPFETEIPIRSTVPGNDSRVGAVFRAFSRYTVLRSRLLKTRVTTDRD